MDRNIKKSVSGFTLIETLIVIGVISILAMMSLFMNLNNYRGDSFRSEVSSLGMTLQTARANALNNINQKPHGVAIHPGGYDGYIIFEGSSYAVADHTRDISIKASYNITLAPSSPAEIIFKQLSGNALNSGGVDYDGEITFVDPQRNMTAIISINHEGKISW